MPGDKGDRNNNVSPSAFAYFNPTYLKGLSSHYTEKGLMRKSSNCFLYDQKIHLKGVNYD